MILLVEDDPNDEILTIRALRKAGIREAVTTVRDGGEALDYLFRTGRHADRDPEDRPRLILLDMNLPVLNGLDVLRSVREDPRTETIPVLVLTGSEVEDAQVRTFGLGANGYVRKPLDLEVSLDSSQRIALHWLLLNRAAPDVPRRS